VVFACKNFNRDFLQFKMHTAGLFNRDSVLNCFITPIQPMGEVGIADLHHYAKPFPTGVTFEP
jgi:hypothetical protein